MIEINLLPEERRKKESRMPKLDISRIAVQSMPVLKLSTAIICGLIAAQLILFLFGVYSKMQLESYTREYDKIAPKRKEADLLKKQVNITNKKMKAIDELMVKRFSWAHKLDALNDAMTPGVWLATLSYEEKPAERAAVKAARGEGQKGSAEKAQARYLMLSGFASRKGEEGTALVGRFIRSLKNNEAFFSDFSDIELVSIKSEKVDEQEVMNFKITCLFKEKEDAVPVLNTGKS